MKAKHDWNKLLKMGVVVLAGLVCILSIYLSMYLGLGERITEQDFAGFISLAPWVFISFITINLLFASYIFYNKTLRDIIYLTILSQFILSILLWFLSYLGLWSNFSWRVIFINFFVGVIMIGFYNSLMYKVYQQVRGQKKIMIVGQDNRVLEAVKNFDLMKNRRHEVTHVVLNNFYENVKIFLNDVDIVYLTGYIDEKERLKIYEFLMQNNKKLFISTSFENLMMVNPNIMNFEDESIIEVSGFEIPAEEEVIKRLMDILVSFVLVIVTLPIVLITALAIKLDSPGPVLYKQERITKNQRSFKILKFRSMTQTAEDKTGPVLASFKDDRITRVGRFIRATRIDELPQLLNVLKGDMSLVGPRPERPYFVEQFKDLNPYYSLRHHVRAGITGYAQVYGKYSTDFNNKLNFDLLYIKNYSLAFDFKLLFQTIKILFDKVSSRGVEEVKEREFSWNDYKDKLKIIR